MWTIRHAGQMYRLYRGCESPFPPEYWHDTDLFYFAPWDWSPADDPFGEPFSRGHESAAEAGAALRRWAEIKAGV